MGKMSEIGKRLYKKIEYVKTFQSGKDDYVGCGRGK